MRMRNTRAILSIIFAAGLLFSCSLDKEVPSPVGDRDSAVPIVPRVSIGFRDYEAKGTLHGVVRGTTFPTSTDSVFAMTAYKGDAKPVEFSPNSRINNAVAKTDETNTVVFVDPRYYPEEGKLYFYGYSPIVGATYFSGSGESTPKVKWKITGEEDILWAKNDKGIAKNPVISEQEQPDLQFRHLLTQLQFKMIKGSNFPDNAKVNSISLLETQADCTLDLINGELSWQGSPDQAVTLKDKNMYVIGNILDYPLLVKPDITSASLVFTINERDYSIVVPLDPAKNQGKAGYATLLNLTFSGSKLSFTTELTDWINIGSTSGNI